MTFTVFKSVDQLAFNVSLVAYDHGLDSNDFKAGQRLGFKEIKRNRKLVDSGHDDYTVPSVKPTYQELSIDQSEHVGVWVGMWVPTVKSTKESEGSSNNKGKSIKALALRGGYTLIKTDPKALRVVVPMHKETASYYALVDQDSNGLCIGLSVVITEVFFFPQFRNDELTDTAKRKSEWSELVRTISNPVEKISFAKQYDKTKFQVSPKRSLANELSSFVGTYIEGGNSSVLRSALELIDRADTDGVFIPPSHNNALAKLTQSTTKMSEAESEAALSELTVLAPDLKQLKISSQDLRNINTGLLDSKTTLPYAHLRAFTVQYMYRAHGAATNDSSNELNLGDTVGSCARLVRLQLGGKPAFSEPQGDLGGLRFILDGQKKKLQDFMGYIRQSITALKDSQGDSAIATAPTLPQIWTKYGLSPDLDSAKLYAMGVHRHNVEALSTILATLETMIRENCEQLEKLTLSIPPTEDEEIGQEAQENDGTQGDDGDGRRNAGD